LAKIKLYSLTKFVDSVKQSSKYRNVSDITLAGFKATMKSQDKEYVFNEQEYVDALDEYLK
jgi:hypothetical protein